MAYLAYSSYSTINLKLIQIESNKQLQQVA